MPYGYFFAICLLLLHAQTFAAQILQLNKLPLKSLPPEFHLQQKQNLINQPNQLRIISQHQSINKIYHIRLQQYYKNIPVYDGYVILHSHTPYNSPNIFSSTSHLDGQLFTNISLDLKSSSNIQEKTHHESLNMVMLGYKKDNITQHNITTIIFVDQNNIAHKAYKICLKIMSDMPSMPCKIVDAKTSAIYLQWDNLKTKMADIKAQGFSGNQLTGQRQYGLNLPLLNVKYNSQNQTCLMENDTIKIIDMLHKKDNKIHSSMSFPCISNVNNNYWTGKNNDGYDKINDAYSPSNDAFYAAEIINNLYKTWYQINPLKDYNGNARKLIMRVHFANNFANAFWDGITMTFGDGDSSNFYPFTSIGIGAHELSHGFTEQHSGLHYYGQAGGIDEAFSDMAAKAAEFFAGEKIDWRIGWEIIKPSAGFDSLRYMDNPKKDGYSVNTIAEYEIANKNSLNEHEEELDVHYASGIYNRLFYLLATTPNWDIHKAFDVMVYANIDYWTPNTNFQTGGCGILNAATDLHYELDDIKQALEQVGIDVKPCV